MKMSLKQTVNKQAKLLAYANDTVYFGEVALVAIWYDRLHPRQEKMNAW